MTPELKDLEDISLIQYSSEQKNKDINLSSAKTVSRQ
jgi:hypothetical protein